MMLVTITMDSEALRSTVKVLEAQHDDSQTPKSVQRQWKPPDLKKPCW